MSDLEEQMQEALAIQADSVSERLANELREEYLTRAQNAEQGAQGLEEFVSEVEQVDDGEYIFKIDHPTARLHEIGAPIEPTYTYAKLEGYSRDDFYEALEDCEDVVTQKRLLHRSRMSVRFDHEGRNAIEEVFD